MCYLCTNLFTSGVLLLTELSLEKNESLATDSFGFATVSSLASTGVAESSSSGCFSDISRFSSPESTGCAGLSILFQRNITHEIFINF